MVHNIEMKKQIVLKLIDVFASTCTCNKNCKSTVNLCFYRSVRWVVSAVDQALS